MIWSRRDLLVQALSVAGVSSSGDPAARARSLESGAGFGARTGNLPYPNLDSFYQLEARLGRPLREMSWFIDWEVGWKADAAQDAAAHGKDLLIGWSAQLSAQRGSAPVPFAEILSGRHDPYIRAFLSAASAYPWTVRIRPFHEMNGNWYPWSMAHPRRSVESIQQWTDTWRHVVNIGRTVASNVEWVWCVNNQDIGGVALERYYPGGAHVDVLGIDGYNGLGRPNEPWAEPFTVINPVYQRLARLNPRLPMAICELGSREARPDERRSKAQWISQLLTETRFPRITRVNFFSKDRWALDTSPGALVAARAIGRL